MLIDIEVELESTPQRAAPAVRLWLDLDPQAGFHTELEALLRPSGRARWTGSFDVPRPKLTSYFLYRLALRAAPHTAWSLSLRDRESGRALFSDTDMVALPKTWVMGTCSLSAVE